LITLLERSVIELHIFIAIFGVYFESKLLALCLFVSLLWVLYCDVGFP